MMVLTHTLSRVTVGTLKTIVQRLEAYEYQMVSSRTNDYLRMASDLKS